jgi:hypothetical protein
MQPQINLVDKLKEDILEKIGSSFDVLNVNNNSITDIFLKKQTAYLETIYKLEDTIKQLGLESKKKDENISDLLHDLENMNKVSYTKKLDKLLTEEKREKVIIMKKNKFLLKEIHKLKEKLKEKKKKSNNLEENNTSDNLEENNTSDNLEENNTPDNLEENNTSGNLEENNTSGNLEENNTPDNLEENNTPDNLEENYNIIEYKGREFFLKIEGGNHLIYQINKQNKPGKNIGYMKNGKIYKKKK